MTDHDPSDPAAAEAPAVIHLPDQSQPEPAPRPGPQPGRHTGRMKGRHFGPRPVKDPLAARFNVRCPPEFLATLQAEAETAGLSLSAYVCTKLGGSPGPRAHRRRKPGPDMMLLAQVKASLGRNGGSLHQIAKQLNSYDFRGIPALLALRELAETALAEHRETSAAVMQALGGRSVTDNH